MTNRSTARRILDRLNEWLAVPAVLTVVFALLFAMSHYSCTANQRAKQWGGVYKVSLPCGHKLSFATWKDSNLWYAVRPFRAGEEPETTTMLEDSDYGVMKGKVVFEECAK